MVKKTKKNKMWGGRFASGPSSLAEEMNASVHFDYRLYEEDIEVSIVHARMLGKQKIISTKEANLIISGLRKIRKEFDNGNFSLDKSLEDIHMNIEKKLENKIGKTANKLHTARSRNDQVATDFRMYLRKQCYLIFELLKTLQEHLVTQAEKHFDTIMPGFTHMQIAQPITLGHHFLAYVEMLERDKSRFKDCIKRLNENPLGAVALAGTSFPIDRKITTKELNFSKPMSNSIDAVSSRDFVMETLSFVAISASHLSRLSEEIVIWVSDSYNFIELPDKLSTGSSIMPQKKNPDIAELIRGKTGRILGALMSIFVIMKALPLAYSKDLQEDKELTFDALDNFIISLKSMIAIIHSLKPNKKTLALAAGGKFSTATDLADWLTFSLKIPFRVSHKITGEIVKHCEDNNLKLHEIDLDTLQSYDKRITGDIFKVLDPESSVKNKTSEGGTSPNNVKKSAIKWKKKLAHENL